MNPFQTQIGVQLVDETANILHPQKAEQ